MDLVFSNIDMAKLVSMSSFFFFLGNKGECYKLITHHLSTLKLDFIKSQQILHHSRPIDDQKF